MIWNSCMTRWSDQGTWEPLKSIAVRVQKENKWLQWVFVDIDIIIWSWFSRISIFCASILLWSWSVKYTFLYHRNKTNNLQVFFISIKIRIRSSNQTQKDVEYTHRWIFFMLCRFSSFLPFKVFYDKMLMTNLTKQMTFQFINDNLVHIWFLFPPRFDDVLIATFL